MRDGAVVTDPQPGDWTTWPESALTLLDELWKLEMSPAIIRQRLWVAMGCYPTNAVIKAAARRKSDLAFITIPILTPAPRPRNAKTSRVAKGTFPVTGFSMIGGRIR